MTTIAFKNGVLVADSMASAGDERFPVPVNKVFRRTSLGHTYLIAGAGSYSLVVKWMRAFDADIAKNANGESPTGDMDCARLFTPEEMNMVILHQTPDDDLKLWELGSNGSFCVDPAEVPYYSIGSGSSFALGAMAAGASAVEAVMAATIFDVWSAGEVHGFSIHDDREIRELSALPIPKLTIKP